MFLPYLGGDNPRAHHSALGMVTALSQPFDQLPSVFSQRLARFTRK